MYILNSDKKREAIKPALEKAHDEYHHLFAQVKPGVGGLLLADCVHCGRSIYVNVHGNTFGSALREKCR